jgi:uncharacterized protein (TIGR02145 family)
MKKRKKKNQKLKEFNLSKLVFVTVIFLALLPSFFSFLVPTMLRNTLADHSHSGVPGNTRTSYIQELYNTLKDDLGHGTESAGSWGDYGSMWNRIFSSALRQQDLGDLWSDGQQQDLHRSQAYVMYDDSEVTNDVNHVKLFSSPWTQVYDDTDGEIWRDERTGLYWTNELSTEEDNNFNVGDCNFFDLKNRGSYDGSDLDCGDAINYCATLDLDGMTNWYLPTRDELSQAHINGMYIETDVGFATDSFFWSSTEYSGDVTKAWTLNVSNGRALEYGKTNELSVRCVTRDSFLTTDGTESGGNYPFQSIIKWDDYKSEEEGYEDLKKHSSSYWTQESSSNPEIWKDERTGLYWSDKLVDLHSNEIDVDCDFYDIPRGGYEGGDSSCSTAINLCADLNTQNGGDGYGNIKGWYLPTKDELSQAYLNGILLHTGISFTTNEYFWSSTVSAENTANVFSVWLSSGRIDTMDSLAADGSVRCVSSGVVPVVLDIPQVDPCGEETVLVDTRDGDKEYPIIGIGNQCWMAKNLDYDDGCSNETWANYEDKGWCGYHGDDTGQTHGLLYQWSAAMAWDRTGDPPTESSQGICPEGWALPSDSDWYTLEKYFKVNVCNSNRTAWGCSPAGDQLKASSANWCHGTPCGESGFEALGASYRNINGSFSGTYFNELSFLWSSSSSGTTDAWARYLISNNSGVDREAHSHVYGCSVRCIKD